MRRHLRRGIASAAFGGAVALSAALVWSPPAHAQVEVPALPQLPPVPPEAQPVLEIIAPIASPMCGNALLLAIAAPTLVPVALPIGISALLAPVFVACASVPVPEGSTQLVCAPDDEILGALGTATGAAIGSGPPVSAYLVGPVVEIAFVVQSKLPAPANAAGGAEALSSALSCRALRSAAPPQDSSPSTSPDDSQDTDFVAPAEDFTLPGLLPSTFDETATSSTGMDFTPAQQQPAAPALTRIAKFAYPGVLVLPLLLLALGGYLARSLTAEVRLPD